MTPPQSPPSRPRFPDLLTVEQQQWLVQERRLLEELRTALARHDGSAEDDARLASALDQLDRLFLIVVAGEFNAGKSAVLNALVGEGERVLPEGVTPTTDRITLLQHPDNVREPVGEDDASAVAVVTTEADVLRHLDVVDTPGTNAVLREHESVTRDFIPRADLVLFVTSADRPFSESEREFLSAIRDWGKKVAVVVNKTDIILTAEDVERVVEFVEENARALLGFAPAIFPLSARQAQEAKAKHDRDPGAADELQRKSRIAALEGYIVDTLDEAERMRLKLLSPLEVGRRLARRYLEVADEREALLAEDFQALADIEEQLTLYREDLGRQYRFRRSDVENVLGAFERRGVEFFEETVRLGRIFDLTNRSKVKSEFERKVVADLPREIEGRVSELIDWLVERDVQQWEAIREHVARRRSEHADRIVGREGRGFDRDRQRLLESIGRTAQRTIETYDREQEADRLAESVQRAVAGAALLEVGALGLGATVAAVASTTVADVTGLLTAGVLFTLGLFVLPARKRKAQRELHGKIDKLRARLLASLDGQFEREIDKSVERIREAISPYTRFVRAERQKLDDLRSTVGGLQRRLGELAEQIEG